MSGGLLDRAHEVAARHRDLLVDLHRHPELSWHEVRTTNEVGERLRALGLEPETFPDMTGLTADVVLGPGPVVALRADLDALPIHEPVRDGASEAHGISHACGHDVHTVSLVAAAELLLAETGRRDGTVRLVFQPAEEAIPGGAPEVLASGRLDGVEAIAALHCDPSLRVGTFGVRSGPITSAADRLCIELRGDGGHTARPELTHDLVRAVSRVAVELPDRVRAALADTGDVSIVFGHVGAGDAPNVIPTDAVLQGTLRTRSKEVWDAAPELVRDELAELVGPTGPSWSLLHQRGNPPVVNDPTVTDVARRALVGLVGADRVVEADQSLGSEDFSWYLEELPGTYVRLGVAAEAPGPDLHTAAFEAAPDAIAFGSAALAATALELLSGRA